MTTPLKQTGVNVSLAGQERSVFTTISVVRRALMQAGIPAKVASDYTDVAARCHSYEEVLRVSRETVNIAVDEGEALSAVQPSP